MDLIEFHELSPTWPRIFRWLKGLVISKVLPSIMTHIMIATHLSRGDKTTTLYWQERPDSGPGCGAVQGGAGGVRGGCGRDSAPHEFDL